MKSLFRIFIFSLMAVVCRADELDQHAKVVEAPVPTYPSVRSYEAKEGVVSVAFEIDEKGDARVVRVMCSSSYRFVDAVREVAPSWKFSPGIRSGRRVTDTLEFLLFFSPEKEVEIVGPLYES